MNRTNFSDRSSITPSRAPAIGKNSGRNHTSYRKRIQRPARGSERCLRPPYTPGAPEACINYPLVTRVQHLCLRVCNIR